MSSSDLFQTLPRSVQNRIDRAFDATVSPNWEHNRNSTSRASSIGKLDSGGGFLISDSKETEGGFLVEDPGPSGGGFLVDDDEMAEDHNERPDHIPMPLIPAALQRLDLPPDEEEILSVFRNAASGWSSSKNTVGHVDENEDFVSRDDWRSVCAVLLEDHGSDDETGEGSDEARIQESDDDGQSDGYRSQRLNSESSEEDSDDEYVEGPSTSAARRRRPANRTKPSSPSFTELPSKTKKPTARQQETCLEAFALFFPSISLSDLPKQRIMVKDIQRVAKVLGEKIKAEGMIEMLEMFSSSPDKSMDLVDFSRMMVTAKLA